MDFKWSLDVGSLINASTLIVVAWKLGAIQLKLNLLWNWFQREHKIAATDSSGE
jgi:hypothetical protein